MIIPFTELHPFIPVLVWKRFFHLSFEMCIKFCLWRSLVILRWPCGAGRSLTSSYWLPWLYQDHRGSERSNFTLHFGVWVCSYYIPPVTRLGGCSGITVSVLSTFPWVQALSRGYLLNRSTFCNQTWYGGASLWGEDIWMLSSRSRPQWGLI